MAPDLVLFGEVLFGEWCSAVHSLHYDALRDWFLGFDVLDRSVASGQVVAATSSSIS